MGYTEKPRTYGDIIEVSEFRQAVKDRSFIDYDGFGYPMRDGMMDSSIRIYPSEIDKLPEDATHVQWFNK